MAEQFARPSEDTVIGTYTNEVAGVVNIYQSMDEVSPPNDADYIRSTVAPVNEPHVTKFSSLLATLTDTGHIVRYRYRKNPGSTAQLDLVVQLRQGYVSEGTPGTLIKAWTHTDIADAFTTATQTLTVEEAATIGDYASLFLRFVFNQV